MYKSTKFKPDPGPSVDKYIQCANVVMTDVREA